MKERSRGAQCPPCGIIGCPVLSMLGGLTLNTQNMFQIDILRLVRACLRRWYYILLAGAVVTALMFAYTAKFVVPMYRSYISIYVNEKKAVLQGQTDEDGSTTFYSTPQTLVDTYVNIIKSRRVLDKVADALDGKYTSSQILNAMSIEQVGKTAMCRIYISYPDPVDAATIANAVGGVAPDEINELISGTTAWIIDSAEVPQNAYSPNYKNQIQKGFIVGCVMAIAAICAVTCFDTRIKSEDDLLAVRDIPIIGQIPDLSVSASGKQKYGKYYKSYKSYSDYATSVSENAASADEAKPKGVRK